MSDAPAKTIRLSSPMRRLMVIVRPTVEKHDGSGRGAQVVEPGVRLQFVDGFCEVTEELFEEASKLDSYGRLWTRADSADALVPEDNTVRIVDGALHVGGSSRNRPPVDGWDSLTAKAAAELVQSGRVNLDHALAWERAHRRRKLVLRAIADRMADDAPDAPDEAPEAAELEEAIPVFAVPAGQGGL